MTDEQNDREQPPPNRKPGPPVVMIPKSFFYIVGAIVVGSFAHLLRSQPLYTVGARGRQLL